MTVASPAASDTATSRTNPRRPCQRGRAVAAVPGEQEWKQTLREAERELLAAPN